jgi:hypothetical protein
MKEEDRKVGSRESSSVSLPDLRFCNKMDHLCRNLHSTISRVTKYNNTECVKLEDEIDHKTAIQQKHPGINLITKCHVLRMCSALT